MTSAMHRKQSEDYRDFHIEYGRRTENRPGSFGNVRAFYFTSAVHTYFGNRPTRIEARMAIDSYYRTIGG